MKKLLALIVLISIQLSSLAQNEVFRIDSIPSKGILLDKGWKWHAGDNPNFAKPDFDDSQWESIDPTQDVMDLKQFEKANIGWFRLTFKVDSALFGQTFAISVKQTGSSQIFVNGILFKKFGDFSSKTQSPNGFDPSDISYKLTFGNSPQQTLLIKFEKPDFFLIKHIGFDNFCMRLRIIPIEQIVQNYEKSSPIDYLGQSLTLIDVGFFLLVAFLHLWLYFDEKKYVSNLILGICSFFIAVFFIISIYSFLPINIRLRNQISIVLSIAQPVLNFSHFLAIFLLFSNKNFLRPKILLALVLLSIIALFVNYDWGWAVGTLIVPFIISTQIITISCKAYKFGNKPAIGIAIAEILWIFLSIGTGLLANFSSDSYIIYFAINIINYVGFLFPSFAIIYYFTHKFNFNRRNLEIKLDEIEKLSSEKEEALQKQNAELQAALLQGQTIERKRVAADLHDSLGSTMSSLIYTVNAIDTNNLDHDEKNVYLHLKQMLDTAYNEIRLLSHNLLPEEFEKQGLAEALRHFVRKINQTKTIQFDLSIDPQLGRLSPKIEFELYSICLELINNILKHSKATQASITLAPEKKLVKLVISDNGHGFFDNDSDGKGMKNVKARIESLHGTWHTKSTEGNGVCNEISVPI
jgi:signal transduction histidine kinase